MVRKLRGALGTAVTWAVSWAASGFALTALLFVVSPGLELGSFADAAPMLVMLAGISGFVGGTVFSAVLGTVHGRRALGDLRPIRMAPWGALAGLLVPLGLVVGALAVGAPIESDVVGSAIVVFGGLGAATAAATIRLAQSDDRQLKRGRPNGLLQSGE